MERKLTRCRRIYPAVFAPFLFVILFPLAGVVTLVVTHGDHPSIHFSPIR
jgi:hypothetical protein